ncbi:universal stress protein [Cypionkella aquatica]|uniref:Universal stress protein n=1 Tax=Cypionkella aquatica TaxID=1756042 RepID=A0AA37U0Y5_9RHOB|nr:universal stress protein [Cypionkella aquatica]GLS85735.1 universal stress protein [Cypionkella aquatica]
MGYKTILTVLTNPAQAKLSISAAAKLARQQDAHLDVLVLGVDRTQMGYSYIGTGAVIMQVGIDTAEADSAALELEARAALAVEGADLRYGLETVITQLGALTDVVAARARFADLVVQPLPYGDAVGAEAEAAVEAALFEAKAPVLVLPATGLAENIQPKRIIIAWNRSTEALTAVRRALPFLKAADSVTITLIDPPSQSETRPEPGTMLCQMLTRHGVHAEISVLARSLPQVSDVLNQQARDLNADLLVMGAYGHSRLREAILGGATRSMLEAAAVPVLMAH